MNRSNVHLLDLPDEILLIILKKLKNIDVLYSLFDINNERLNILAQENAFTNILSFVSIDDTCLIDRFCSYILPRIRHNVKCFIFDPVLMRRILHATDYPNLTKLIIFHFQQEIALRYFRYDSSLRTVYQQITDLTLINNDKDEMIPSLKIYTTNVYSHILTFFKNLKSLTVIEPSARLYYPGYPGLSLGYLPSTTFSSSILTFLYINVKTFDDCLCLLDGRLEKLRILCVTVYSIDKSSGIIPNTDQLCNLKCFSLKSFYKFQQYDKIVSLLRRMSYLENLTLYLLIEGRNRVIDGTYVQHDILDYMPQLHSFTFYICTYVDTVGLSYKLSSEDIQQTLKNIGQQHATSIVNYINGGIAACSIFSLPFEFNCLNDLGNNFPDIVFSYVTYLIVEDTNSFKHEFFIRIARSFPWLKYLRILNSKSSGFSDILTFSSDNCQLYSSIVYSSLIRLDLSYAHRDYVEQLLNEKKTYIPCLTELRVSFRHLKDVTKDFQREETRRNCAKVKKLTVLGPRVCLKDFCLYFPLLHK